MRQTKGNSWWSVCNKDANILKSAGGIEQKPIFEIFPVSNYQKLIYLKNTVSMNEKLASIPLNDSIQGDLKVAYPLD